MERKDKTKPNNNATHVRWVWITLEVGSDNGQVRVRRLASPGVRGTTSRRGSTWQNNCPRILNRFVKNQHCSRLSCFDNLCHIRRGNAESGPHAQLLSSAKLIPSPDVGRRGRPGIYISCESVSLSYTHLCCGAHA